MPERESPKRTISVSGGFGLLQMVSEQDIGQCANEDVEPRRGVDTEWRGKAQRGVDCEIPHRLERGTKHSL